MLGFMPTFLAKPGVVFDCGLGMPESVAMVWDRDNQPLIVHEGDWVSPLPDVPDRYRVIERAEVEAGFTVED